VLEKMALNGTLALTLTDGTVLVVNPSSLRLGPEVDPLSIAPAPSKKPLVLIAVITVLLVLLVVFLVARFYVVRKRRRTKIETDSRPTSARSLIVDSIRLEEKDAVGESNDTNHASSYDNKGAKVYDQSKKQLCDQSKEQFYDQGKEPIVDKQRVQTYDKNKGTPKGRDNVVTVGIGSSLSLKNSELTDC